MDEANLSNIFAGGTEKGTGDYVSLMECNKEEAMRAKNMVQNKMGNKDLWVLGRLQSKARNSFSVDSCIRLGASAKPQGIRWQDGMRKLKAVRRSQVMKWTLWVLRGSTSSLMIKRSAFWFQRMKICGWSKCLHSDVDALSVLKIEKSGCRLTVNLKQ
ncbi:Uncharacterized protein Fot_54909 [Forsythia ovata]|uniref:Uncharacterized protein n=1 Tax=Forsythia ovata TaxID=205694 RepID=A0ABD1P5R7_9LAMI